MPFSQTPKSFFVGAGLLAMALSNTPSPASQLLQKSPADFHQPGFFCFFESVNSIKRVNRST
jgi:hypothetical protein